MAKQSSLEERLDTLEKLHGRPETPPSTDAFELVLWENVAYLVDDERRKKAFQALKANVGTEPEAVAGASDDDLYGVAAMGGMHPERRAAALRSIAEIALEHYEGDLSAVLELPAKKAIRALKKFPSIGEPGAEKILLFTGARPILALESNGLRVLIRLGYGKESKSYQATYRSVREAIAGEIVPKSKWMIRAHQLLRRHGQEICKRSRPLCESCPLAEGCEYFRRSSSRSAAR